MALDAIKGEKTLAQLAAHYDVHANQITSWKAQLLEQAAGIFGAGDREGHRRADPEPSRHIAQLRTLTTL